MGLEIRRLHLASLEGVDGRRWPVHGFVVMHPKGCILVDTGVGGPEEVLTDWRVVNRSAAEALGEHDLAPGDVALVVNTHLHFDHCGQNAVFRHAPFYVQRLELERARRHARALTDWFDFAGARFELLDGDAAYTPAIYRDPGQEDLPRGQAADREAWAMSLRRLHASRPHHVHFCHHTHVLHS